MNVGDISQPIETEWGFHILKVEENKRVVISRMNQPVL
jgi:parvulin-like peptidyl-prolyl isomerase